MSPSALTRTLRLTVSLTGLMLAGTALAPASAQVLDLQGLTVSRSQLNGFNEVTNGVLRLTPGAGGYIYNGGFTDLFGQFGLVKLGTNSLTLTGSGLSTYSDTTTISAGVIIAGANNVTSANSLLNTAGSGVLQLAGWNQTVNGLIGTGAAGGVRNLGPLATLTISSAADNVFSGNIGGTGGTGDAIRVVKSGGGRQTFNRASAYTGGTELAAGTLAVGNSAALGTGAVDVTGASTLRSVGSNLALANNFNLGATLSVRGNSLILFGDIAGSGRLDLTGTGVALLGNNTFTGGVYLESSALLIGGPNTLGTGVVTASNFTSAIGASSVAFAGGDTVAIANNILMSFASPDRGINFRAPDAGNTLAIDGTISGVGRLLFSGGGGTVRLNQANSFVGSINVNNGLIGIGANGALGGASNLIFINGEGPSGLTANVAGLTIANEIRAANQFTIDTNGFDLTYTGLIRNFNTAGAVTKAGAGTLILTGAKTYTGATAVNAGTLQLGGSLTSDVTVASGATLSGAGTVAAANTVTVADGGILSPGVGGPGTLTFGNLVLGAGSVLNFDLAAPNAPGGGAGSDLIIVTNNLTLAGTINTTALLGFDAGTYRVINYGALLANNILLAGTGPAGFTYSIVTTTGVGGGAGGVNLLVAFDGPRYWDGTGPFGNVVNGGDGVWTAGATNWTDATGVGVLSWANTEGVFAGSAGTVSVVGPQTFTSLTFTTGGYVLTDGGSGSLVTNGASVVDTATAASDVTVFDLPVSGAGSIVKQGVGYLDLVRGNAYAGGTDIQGGTVRAYTSGSLGTGDVTMADGTGFDLVTGGLAVANNFALTGVDTFRVYNGLSAIDGVISGSGSLFYDEAGTLALNAANTYSGGTTINFGAVQVGNNAALGTGSVTIVDNTTLIAGVGGLALANAITTLGGGKVDSGPGVFTLDGDISGPGSISQVGAGNLVLNGANSFVNLGINQGTVTVGSNTAAGSGGISIGNNATLAAGFDGLVLANGIQATGSAIVNGGPGVFTLDGNIGGTGSISSVGAGNLVLNGANSFVNLGINHGTVTVGTNTAAGSGGISINDNATLAAGASGLVLANGIETTANGIVDGGPGIFTLDGNIGGAGSISSVGTGNLVLNGNNSFVNLGINQGIVTVGSNTAAGSGGITINDNATLAAGIDGLVLANGIETTGNGIVDSGAGTFTLDGGIGGAGGITKTGAGTLELAGASNYTGATNVSTGTLDVTGALGNTAVTVASGATLSGTGSIAGSVTIADGGILSPGGANAGTLTVGPLNLSGGSILNWQLGAANTIGGPLNDLVAVNGDLVLDGQLNVTETAGGLFTPGIYNLITYTGGLTDNILSIGSLANGATGTVQTLVDGQVNLIVLGSPTVVLYWDGADGVGNGVISGGSGTWNLSNTNWTGGPPSALNASWQQNTLGVFNAPGGTVDIADSIQFQGLQFAGDGYVLNASGAGELVTTSSSFLFTDGGVTTTINAPINGAGSISKTGLGTLALNGNNSFVNLGINQGTVTVGSNTAAGSGGISINDNATLAAGVDGLVFANGVATTANGIVDNGGFTFTLASTIGGAGSISSVGAGNLVLNGNNSFNGLGINQGTVTVGTNTAAGIGGISINDNATFAAGVDGLVLANGIATTANGIVDNGGFTFTLNGAIGGAGSISSVGTGNLVLNGNNSFVNLGINQGTVTVGTNTAAGIGGITINNNATLAAGFTGLELANGIETTGNGIVRVSASRIIMVLNGNIGGAGSISAVGGGILALNGNNSFVNLGINEGTVVVGTNTAAGAGGISINNDATLAAGVAGLVLANGIETTANGIIDNNGTVFTLNGNIGGAGSISSVDTGNLVLNGNNSFVNLGINQGTVTVGSDTAAGSGGISLSDNATLANNKDVTLANAVTTIGNGLVDVQAGTTLTLNGNIDGGSGAAANIVTNGNFETGSLSGWSVTGAGFDWTATTGGLGPIDGSFYAATGCVGVACPLSQTVTTTAGESYMLSYAFNPGLGSPAGGSARWNGVDVLTMPAGPAIWTNYSTTVVATGASSLLQFFGRQDPSFNGLDVVSLQQVGGGGFGSLSQIGLGTLVLNGDNSFVNLGINQGTVQVGSDTAAGVGGISINDNATLQSGGAAITLANGIVTTANGLVNARAGEVLTLNGNISGPGSISQVGLGNLVLNGDNSFTNLGINQGTVTVGTNTAAGIGGISINDNATLAAGVDGLVLANGIETTANGIVDNGGFTFTLASTIGGAGSISSVGLGNLVLNGDNSFVNLGINQGTVTVGTNTAAGIGGISINDNATLAAGVDGLVLANGIATTANGIVDNAGFTFTLDGDIGGAGSISSVGLGNLVLNGNNSFVNLGINQGTVTVGSDTAAGVGGISINDNATLAAGVDGLVLANDIATTANGIIDNAGFTFTLDGNIGGAGSISSVGLGNLVLNGDNSFVNLGINQGTVTVGSDTAAGSGGISINDNATLAAGTDGLTLANGIVTTANGIIDNGGFTVTLDGDIAGPGSISSIGLGTLVLNGDNSFVNLGINQGTVQVGSNTAAGVGGISINDNATLQSGGAAITLANGIVTTANGLVNARAGEVLTLDGNISGPGSISQVGLGNLVLNGDNSFVNLGINQGTVTVGTNTAAGIGGISINNNATLAAGVSGLVLGYGIVTTANGIVDSGPGVFTLNGPISGAGSISQVGLGNLVLNGNNSFTNLGINQGTVTVGTNTAAGIGGISINNNATLAAGVSGLVLANGIATTANGIINSGPGIFTLNGPITGAGSISQVGLGNLVLNGNNSFNGLGINQGTVTVGTNTAAGSGGISINDNATLAAGVSGLVLANAIATTANGIVDSGPGVFTLNGNIGGAGSISQVGTGNLVLNGNNSFRNLGINQGKVTLGTNTAGGIGAIAINNNATLVAGANLTLANQVVSTATGFVDTGAFTATLNGVISGSGSLTKQGSGTLVVNAINTITGPTTVAAGRLTVNGSLATSATTVQSGAIIGGTGTVGNLLVQSGGTVAPGNPVGTLSVNGSVTLAAGSTYQAEINGPTGDRITASGPASIAGNLVVTNTTPVTGGATFNSSYILLSSSARTGTFATTALGNYGNVFNPTLEYTATSVILRLAPNSLVTIGGGTLTGNPLAVANAFDAAVRAGYNPQPFFALYTQGANLPNALSQLSGELHSAERRVLLEDTRVVRETAFDRLNAGLSAISGAQTVTATDGDKATTFWLRAAGSWGTADGDAVGSRFETEQRGVLTGIDFAQNGFKAGAMFHYTHTDLTFDSLGKSKLESTGGALYAGYRQPGQGFAVGLGGSIAGNKARGSRAITAPGLQQTLASYVSGTTYQIFGEVAYDLVPGDAVRAEPFGRVAHAQVRSGDFTEVGGIAALVGKGQRNDLTVVDAGVRGALQTGIAELSASAAWHRTTGDVTGLTYSSITGLNSDAGIRAAALDRDAVALEAKADFSITPMIKIGAGYSGVIGSNNKDHGARATLTIGF